MWILLREVDLHYQAGKYFVAAWNEKPTAEVLKGAFPEASYQDSFWDYLLAGGGRISDEPTWYSLIEYKEGAMFDPTECDGLTGGY